MRTECSIQNTLLSKSYKRKHLKGTIRKIMTGKISLTYKNRHQLIYCGRLNLHVPENTFLHLKL